MKQIIRESVFETNSSSQHVLVLVTKTDKELFDQIYKQIDEAFENEEDYDGYFTDYLEEDAVIEIINGCNLTKDQKKDLEDYLDIVAVIEHGEDWDCYCENEEKELNGVVAISASWNSY